MLLLRSCRTIVTSADCTLNQRKTTKGNLHSGYCDCGQASPLYYGCIYSRDILFSGPHQLNVQLGRAIIMVRRSMKFAALCRHHGNNYKQQAILAAQLQSSFLAWRFLQDLLAKWMMPVTHVNCHGAFFTDLLLLLQYSAFSILPWPQDTPALLRLKWLSTKVAVLLCTKRIFAGFKTFSR